MFFEELQQFSHTKILQGSTLDLNFEFIFCATVTSEEMFRGKFSVACPVYAFFGCNYPG